MTDTTALGQATALASALSPEDALSLVYALERQHDWGTMIVTPRDAAGLWGFADDDPRSADPYAATLTDAELDALTSSWHWRKGFGSDGIWSLIWDIVGEAIVEAKTELAIPKPE